MIKYLSLALICSLFLISCASEDNLKDIQYNTWTMLNRDEYGARRASSFRYVDTGAYFLQWGYMGFVTEFYGNPDEPFADNPEYDIVTFNAREHIWKNQFPFGKEEEWSHNLPPLHQCSSYQGITTGSRRPQLKMRDGVLRPDLNIVFDQLAYDSSRDRMIYFTGGRTFAYDISSRAWGSIDSKNNPPPILGGSLCYDPLSDRVILFGGGHVAESGPDGKVTGYTSTWALDCASGQWKKLETLDNQPPPRMCSRLVYDSSNRVMVIFGGDSQKAYLGDTWVFDPATDNWNELKTDFYPPPRAGHFTVFDLASGMVIIGGGYNRDNLSDMWGLDIVSGKWKVLEGTVPEGWYITADIDPVKRHILLTSSKEHPDNDLYCNEIFSVRETYIYKISNKNLVRENQPSNTVARSPMLKRPLEQALAGTQPDPIRKEAQMKFIADMPVNQWVKLDRPGRDSPIRTWGSISFDTDRGRIINWGGGHCGYGGNDYDFYDVEQNTWISKPEIPEYPERAWNNGINPAGVTFEGAPWIRHGRKVYAYDPVSKLVVNTKKVILTAGYDPPPMQDIEPIDSDFGSGENFKVSTYTKWTTWTFDPETEKWDILCSGLPGLDLTVSTPYGVMAVDHNWGAVTRKTRPDMVVVDGDTLADNSVYLLNVNAKEWKKLTRKGPWPQNLYEMTALVYDSKRDRLLLHGGGENRDELWSFSLKNNLWRKLSPAGATAPVCNREAVFIPDNDVFLTWSYPPGERAKASLYAYSPSNNSWSRIEIAKPPGLEPSALIAQNRAVTYDPIHDLILMVLGEREGDLVRAVVYAMKYNLLN